MKSLLAACLVIFACGCASKPPPPTPITIGDVISMSKAHATDQEIITRIETSQTVFRLSADQVGLLRIEGVSDPVVNYMMETYPRWVAAQQQQNRPNFSFGLGAGYVGH